MAVFSHTIVFTYLTIALSTSRIYSDVFIWFPISFTVFLLLAIARSTNLPDRFKGIIGLTIDFSLAKIVGFYKKFK